MLFANVIVEISHEKVDKMFQYRIPEALCSKLAVGMVVTFPFGRGNRPTKGYVVEITEKPEYDITKIKEISGVVESAYGYHFIKRYSNDDEMYKLSSETLKFIIKSQKFLDVMDGWKKEMNIVINEELYNTYK